MIGLNDSKKIKCLFILIFAGFVISAVLIMGYVSNQSKDYPKLALAKAIDATIVTVSTYQSVALVELDNGEKCMIVDTRNYEYQPYLIQDFLQIGDHLKKTMNSDTLMVERGGQMFTFVIGKTLHQELPKPAP